jgi:hypothetical protein
MLKAGALYYAILISFLVALLCGFLMINIRFHHYHTLMVSQNLRLQRNVNSALVLALEKPGLVKTSQSQTIDLFGEDDDKVQLSSKLWGGFIVLKSESSWNNLHYSKTEMCGSDIFTTDTTALYLTDKEQYLSISGNTILHGNCFLPKLGIRKAFIEGMSFTGKQMIDGRIYNSKKTLPETEIEFSASNQNYLEKSDFRSDSVFSAIRLLKADSLSNSFNRKTVLFYTDQWLNLSNKILVGNIKVVSSKGVTLYSSAKLTDVIVYAPKIEVMSGFGGSVQLFATDSIIIREKTTLLYPSLIALFHTSIKNPLIEIEKDCRLAGDIVILNSKKIPDAQLECRLSENDRIFGRVYCDGKLHLKGAVYGSVYCNGFILRTPSSLYENHLLDATIDFSGLPKYYAGALFFNVTDRLKIIKCLP